MGRALCQCWEQRGEQKRTPFSALKIFEYRNNSDTGSIQLNKACNVFKRTVALTPNERCVDRRQSHRKNRKIRFASRLDRLAPAELSQSRWTRIVPVCPSRMHPHYTGPPVHHNRLRGISTYCRDVPRRSQTTFGACRACRAASLVRSQRKFFGAQKSSPIFQPKRQTDRRTETQTLTIAPPRMVVMTACPTKTFLSQPCMYIRFSFTRVDSFFWISCTRHPTRITNHVDGNILGYTTASMICRRMCHSLYRV